MVHSRLKHLQHAGELGSLISRFDWARTSLGDPSSWSQSLITSLGIMVENKFPMYLIWGPEMISFYNDAYAVILGKKHPEALGSPSSRIWSEIWSDIGPLFQNVFQGASVKHENLPLIINVDGIPTERFFTFTFTPIRVEDGSVGGILDTVMDTTAEVRSLREITASEENFRKYQEQSPNPFLSLNPDWIITYMNPAAFEVLGLKKEDIIGKVFWSAFPGTKGSIFGDSYEKAMAGEKINFEGYYPLFKRWYRVFAYHLAPGVGIIFQDITEQKNLEQDLQKAIAYRDKFLSVASHELKTPMTSLKLFSQILERDLDKDRTPPTAERLRKFSQQTTKQINRLSHLVDDMLDISRISSGKLILDRQKADFRIVLEETLERLGPVFESHEAGKPQLEILGDDFSGVFDSFRMEQVMNNLFTNALRYGEGRPFRIRLEALPEELILSVMDQGRGISDEDQMIIFDQFSRGINTNSEGLGLGLFISKQIVESHKGQIKVESVLEKGSTFTIRIPRT